MARSVKLEDSIRELIEQLGYELWACVLIGPQASQTVRVYIDRDEGIGISDCEVVSQNLSDFLDVEELIPYQYTLEVSSPGLDRPLFTIEHFKKFIGSKIHVRLFEAMDNKKKLIGVLTDVSPEGALTISVEEQSYHVDFNRLAKANLVY
jgi:ribosome maturation factor RimP